MRGHSTIPLDRAWNSWSVRPAEMTYLPLGVHITPVLYSSRARRTSLIEPRNEPVRFGRHTIDNRLIELETDFAGTSLGFSTSASDPFAIRTTWRSPVLAEWGTRFWLTFAVWTDGGETVRYDPATQAVTVTIDRRTIAIITDRAPIQVTAHESLDDLRSDFETNGYFYTATRGNQARVIGIRFNMEMMREGAYAAAVADSEALAVERARNALGQRRADMVAVHEGRNAGALDAVRDIVGWNTIWDKVNHRPYTAVTRIWNLGEFAVWYNDQTFAALLAGLFDINLARENMAVALAGATPQGNIACIVTSNDAWVDRSQPPHGGLVAWLLYLRSGERSILEASYEALSRNQRWWREHRDPEGFGLISCGTSDVGEGLYKGSVFAARNETGMDNSATHDEAVYDPATRTLSTYDLGLNCALALDAEMLAKMAGILGRPDDAAEFAGLAESSRKLIREHLWDADRDIFANRQRGGDFVRSISPTSFYPLLCRAATEAQAASLLRHLRDERTFAGDFVLPNATRDDPAFGENVYWRGRIWPNVNYMVWLGLRRYGFLAEAGLLASRSYDLFMKSWKDTRIAAENYNATTGEALDQGDTDPFYIWSALLPFMAVEEICGIDPWCGLNFTNEGKDVKIGSMNGPGGPIDLERAGGVLTVSQSGRHWFSTNFSGRLTDVVSSAASFSCGIDGSGDQQAWVTLYGVAPEVVLAARLDDTVLSIDDSNGDARVNFGSTSRQGRLKVWIDAPPAVREHSRNAT
ncbi:MAG: putative trehalase [Rhizobium sp.]|nr:putative trehalase [Rhizobium sp.]